MVMNTSDAAVSIDEESIQDVLSQSKQHDAVRVREILAKSLELKGLDIDDVSVLMMVDDEELLEELFITARTAKETIYGRRIVLFVPLYVSNECFNECLYCAFRFSNKEITRRTLTQEEIAHEVRILVEQGHKRVLLVAGEACSQNEPSYILNAIETIYATKSGPGEIRRINVNISPLDVDGFRELKAAKIGTYQLFQETYHRPTYEHMHAKGKKRDYEWRIGAIDRAMQAGIDDVGVGVLFGLYDWRFEVMALMQHIAHLEKEFGVGCHTISVPRMEPAMGSEVATSPPYPVSDIDFKKIIAIFRLAVPYTGMILSTRENPDMRRAALALGISQISAGSRTNPGGYLEDRRNDGQFSLGDHRPLDEVIRDVAALGYIPSFCTACYRLGRTGEDFMDLAKPGEIKLHCEPNAFSTFTEYLQDYGSPETKKVGEKLIDESLAGMEGKQKSRTETMVAKVRSGKRDVFV